ncbi:hypothetical protein [Rhizobium sp. PAMB 3182]
MNNTQAEVAAQTRLIAATLANALIIASGRPHSVNEALALLKDFQFSMMPNPGHSSYQLWHDAFDGDKPHE